MTSILSAATITTLTSTNVAGTLTTAAQPNITSVGTLSSLVISGSMTYKNIYSAAIEASTVNTIANTTHQLMNLTNLVYDTSASSGMTTTGAANEINIKAAGVYLVSGKVHFASANVTGTRLVNIYKNGTAHRLSRISPAAQGTTASCETAILKLAVNDRITLYGYQNSGTTLNISATTIEDRSVLYVTYLGNDT